jgi:hypothetical protein
LTDRYFVHQTPVWREQTDFIIHIEIEADNPERERHWEQLWAKQVDEARFRVCCIPFFAYDLSLGDEVETRSEGEKRYIVRRVVKASGNYTFRVWFGASNDLTIRDEVMDRIERSGWLFEWYSENLLAISVESARAQDVADYLFRQEQLGRLVYETGRTR